MSCPFGTPAAAAGFVCHDRGVTVIAAVTGLVTPLTVADTVPPTTAVPVHVSAPPWPCTVAGGTFPEPPPTKDHDVTLVARAPVMVHVTLAPLTTDGQLSCGGGVTCAA